MSRTGSRVGAKTATAQAVEPQQDMPKDRSNPLNLLNGLFLSLSQRRRTRSTKADRRSYDDDNEATLTSSLLGSEAIDFASSTTTSSSSGGGGFKSLPSSPSLEGSGRPTTRQAKPLKKSSRSGNTNDLLLSHHPALIQDPKPFTYVVTKDSCEDELVLTLDKNGVQVTMVTGLNSEGQLMRKTLLSVPWYRVKSYEKHIKGHRFALVFQTGGDKVVMKRVVYTTDESARIFQATKRYIAWVAYHS